MQSFHRMLCLGLFLCCGCKSDPETRKWFGFPTKVGGVEAVGLLGCAGCTRIVLITGNASTFWTVLACCGPARSHRKLPLRVSGHWRLTFWIHGSNDILLFLVNMVGNRYWLLQCSCPIVRGRQNTCLCGSPIAL